jgi:ribosome-associated heat shock protein Hsp15
LNKQGIPTLRIDKWLWFTRFFKTRALAAKAVVGGHVKINGGRAKPSATVKFGDVVDLVRDQLPYRLLLGELPVRRGPAAEARATYTEAEESVARRLAILSSIKTDRMQMPRTAGKPDKHTRRKLRDRRRPN